MRPCRLLMLFLAILWMGALPLPSFAEDVGQIPVFVPSETASEDTEQATSDTPSEQKENVVGDTAEEQAEDEDLDFDYDDDPFKKESAVIADPIEPFNRAMHGFNDKLYFWLVKPVATGYKATVPEPARISVKNFFFHLKYPVRLASCLLQADFAGAATETGRFAINTVWGIGGLMDPSAGKELNLQKQDTDLGQTLGVYNVGHGFYIVWPFFGPSSPRDFVDILGNQVLYPLSFVNIWYVSIITKSIETVNSASLRIGDYESLIGAAIDPYVAVRDVYVQYRSHEVQTRKERSLFFKEYSENKPLPDAEPQKK